MIEGLSPYAEMQHCGLPGVEEIPAHWAMAPLASLGRPKKEINLQDRVLLSVYLHLGVIRFSDIKEKRTNATSKDLSKYQGVDPGDFVLNNQQAWRGSVGVSPHRGIVSPAYLVLALNDKLNSSFANLLFRERSMVGQYLLCSKGVGSIQRNLYWPHLKRVTTLLPPPGEQAAIAIFLSHANRKIGRYIKAKRKLIKLLEEQKQAIIYRAVTQGTDAAAPLKRTGVEWLQEVPAHWGIVPSKALFSQRKTKALPGDPMLTASQAHGIIPRDQFIAERGRVMPVIIGSDILKRVEPNDFVISMRSFQGGLEWSHIQGAISSAYVMLVPKESVFPAFFAYLFKSRPYILALRRTSDLVRDGQALRFANFAQIPLPLVPLEEQRRIVSHLDEATTEIVQAQGAAKKEVGLLHEYRTRLTSDVVTGQLDVRAAAAKLPDLASDDDLTEADLEMGHEAAEEDDS